MKALAPLIDFPAASQSTYLNTASVALMYRGCQQAIDDWNRDLAENGTVNFNEHAEQTIFDELHSSYARLLHATPEDIAVASSATEQLSSLAWAIMPPADSKILTTGIVFPTTIYPFARVARHTGAQIECPRCASERLRQSRWRRRGAQRAPSRKPLQRASAPARYPSVAMPKSAGLRPTSSSGAAGPAAASLGMLVPAECGVRSASSPTPTETPRGRRAVC